MGKQDRRRLASGCAAAAALGLTLSAWAGAPAGRYAISADTVFDSKTALTWQRVAPAETSSWSAAASYCQNLDSGGKGWRLPTVKELQSLVDIRSSDPAFDKDAFPTRPANWFFWSSSLFADDPNYAWVVGFCHGATYLNDVIDGARPLCVR